MEHDAVFILDTTINDTSIDVIQDLEKKLDAVLITMGLERVGTKSGDNIEIYYKRTITH